MKTYKFEISNLIVKQIEANNKEEARQQIIERLYDFAEDMIENCCVSDGEEVKDEN